MASVFEEAVAYLPKDTSYKLLPFRFIRLDPTRYVAVNEVGEWQTLDRGDLDLLVHKKLSPESALYLSLKSKHFLEDQDSDVAIDLLTLKRRTKQARIPQFTGLHMFVVTLRCNHSCRYCQVSRQSEAL